MNEHVIHHGGRIHHGDNIYSPHTCTCQTQAFEKVTLNIECLILTRCTKSTENKTSNIFIYFRPFYNKKWSFLFHDITQTTLKQCSNYTDHKISISPH
jgi:hypothetical protein